MTGNYCLLKLLRSYSMTFALLVLVTIITGCASLVSQSNYPVTLNSSPIGAQVTVKNRKGSVIHQGITPSTAMLDASSGYFVPAKYSIEFEKEGFERSHSEISAGLDGWYFGNILFGGLIGLLLVDPVTGAMYKLDHGVAQSLIPDKNYQPPEKPAGATPRIPVVEPRVAADTFAPHPHRDKAAAVLVLDARGGLSSEESALLSDRFSVELEKMGVHKLVSQSKMQEVLTLQNFTAACSSVECAVEAGQLLGVEYIIYGSIGRIGNLYTVNVYLTSVESGSILGSATVDIKGSIEDLLTSGMGSAVDKLLLATM